MSTNPRNVLLLEGRHLKRQAAGRALLDDVSVEVRRGQRLAIVGPSGCGKTLLLRALALLDPLDAGTVLWHGREVDPDGTPRFRSRVIYVHQRPPLVEGTVEDQLRQPFFLSTFRQRRFDLDLQVSRLATLRRDASFLSRRQRDLSGGEAQIVALLRAIQLDPDVLLLDEPTSALDGDTVQAVEQLVRSWLDRGTGQRSVVWVTHDPGQASRFAELILHMESGSMKHAV